MGTDVNTTYLSAPASLKKRLKIKDPYLTFVIKNVFRHINYTNFI